jgi:N-acylneuraminate cytidylyltransferase
LDTSETEPVLVHALDWLLEVCNLSPQYLATLQCTSPLRGADVIERAIDKIIGLDCDAVVGVHPTIDYYFSGRLDGDRFEVGYDPTDRLRTQDIARQYRENGSIYVTRSAFLRKTGCRMGGDTRGLVMTPTEGLDIDDHHDFAMAQHYLELQQRHSMALPALALAI